MKTFHFSLMALLAFVPIPAQDDDTITTTHVAGPIYLLTGRGGNIGVSVGADGILMVDDKFAPLAGNIRNTLAELSQDDLPFLINTHHHGDHTGGNAAFGTETPIIAHTNVRQRLAAAFLSGLLFAVHSFDSVLFWEVSQGFLIGLGLGAGLELAHRVLMRY